MNNNKTQLNSFIAYCTEHPEQRFWQALRNWAQITVNPKINWILTAERDSQTMLGYTNLIDTFYQT